MGSHTVYARDGRTFRIEHELIEVTSLSRADESWAHTDAAGHEHFWTFNGQRGKYRPDAKTELPTLRWVVDGTSYYEDGEPYEYGHYECVLCGEHVQPRTRSDTTRQFVHGLASYYINDEPVSPDVWEAEARLFIERQRQGPEARFPAAD